MTTAVRFCLVSAFAITSRLALAANPSFNCHKAHSPDEIAICADSRLSELDQAGAIAYSQVNQHSRQEALAIARRMLVARRACFGDRLCILDQQISVIAAYSGLGSNVPIPPWVEDYRQELSKAPSQPASGDLPQRIGQCAVTKIASISTRFGEELKAPSDPADSSGSAVSYANKGRQVSYEFIPQLAQSRIGDEVLLCLISIPKDCPPGDDRGRFYAGTNLRTKGSWVMPDSQHMCGGA